MTKSRPVVRQCGCSFIKAKQSVQRTQSGVKNPFDFDIVLHVYLCANGRSRSSRGAHCQIIVLTIFMLQGATIYCKTIEVLHISTPSETV